MLAVARVVNHWRCPHPSHSLTDLWGLLCTVSDDTPLFPAPLASDLDLNQLAQEPAMVSCFLCTQADMSPMGAAIFAKQLCAAAVVTVNDFLCLTHAECEAQKLPPAAVMRLDRCLKQFPHLPTNRHAALGTRGCCAWFVPLRSLAPPVVCFCCAYHAIACANVL